jgi:hypothetical protein
MSTDALPLGVPYEAGAKIFAALRDAATLTGCTFYDNPKRATDLESGDRVVFFEDVSDGPAEQQNQVNREFRFNVGVINRSEADRLGVHTDYRAAKRAIEGALATLKGVATVKYLREGDLVFRLENIDIGGGLIIAQFTLGYRDPSFRDRY